MKATSTIKWTRIAGTYFSKDGLFMIKNAGNSNWYLYWNDSTNFWDSNDIAWGHSLQAVKIKAEAFAAKAVA